MKMNKREKQLKNFKKNRIVGPILFLLVYAVIVGAVISAVIGFSSAFVMDSVLEKGQQVSLLVSSEYEGLQKGGMEPGEIAHYLRDKYQDSLEEIAVLDGTKELVCTGKSTYDLWVGADEEYGLEYGIYPDTEVPFGMGIDKISYFDGNIFNQEALAQDATQIVYWMPRTLNNGNSLLIKLQDSLTYRTIFIFCFIVGLTIILMVFPIFIVFRNIVASFVNQRRMTKLLFFDPITGGNNWMYAKMNGQKYLSKNQNRNFAIVDFELMKYRAYCTCHGIEEGENLLEKIDTYMKKKTSRKEMYAHNSKANFMLLLVGDTKELITAKVQKMWDDLAEAGCTRHIEFHAGILFMDANAREEYKKDKKTKTIEKYYHQASTARATLTNTEGNALVFYNDEMLQAQLWEHKVEDMMEEALKNEEFLVYLQPKYNPVENKLIAAEALVRWNSPTEGFISPGKFIPIFEKTGFVKKLDDYMISHVAKQQAKWISEGKEVVPVSVNVSRAHFADPHLAEHIAELVDVYQVPHGCIEIELTESAFFDDKDMILGTVRKLQENGFEVSMDDFGSGYSSLNSLKDLPLNILKLDAEFFRGENSTDRGKIVVSEAIHLAKSLDMKIVAEGVEKEDQVEFLASTGCDMIQGFYYAKPMPISDFELSAFGGEKAEND